MTYNDEWEMTCSSQDKKEREGPSNRTPKGRGGQSGPTQHEPVKTERI